VRTRKAFERLDGVIADRVDGNRFVAIGEGSLQLDQLRATPWSPVGASVKDDQRFSAGPMAVEVDTAARLIG
jgi:hypothetical protein